ncbi:MAG: hypothetical protein IJR70_06005 [Eubacterium sp.]|nr:hypothetical protein [Eubacterium sp.]
MNKYKEYDNKWWIHFSDRDTLIIEVGCPADDDESLVSIIKNYGFEKYDGYGDGADDTVWYHIYISDPDEYNKFSRYFEKEMKKCESPILNINNEESSIRR